MEITKEYLLSLSPTQVRRDKLLFKKFVEFYLGDGGREKNCYTCGFSSTFQQWKTMNSLKNTNQVNIDIMPTPENTFILSPKAPKTTYIPMEGALLLPTTSDKLAITYLTQDNGAHFKTRRALFSKLPAGIDSKGNLVEDPAAAKALKKAAKALKKEKKLAKQKKVTEEAEKGSDTQSSSAQDDFGGKPDSELTFTELKTKHPDISARGKDSFLEKLTELNK